MVYIFLRGQKNFSQRPIRLNICVMKICKTCDQTKPLTEFYTHSKNCKTCVSKKYHATNWFDIADTAGGYKKTSNTASILGCTFKEFYIHIEQQFTQGMSWANRHSWHIDHTVPLAFAENEQELLALNHYTNLRPLWSIENQNKAGMLTDDSVSHSVYKQIVANRIPG